MEMYQCSFGEFVDLDDPKTYENNTKYGGTTHLLWNTCIAEFGYTFMYTEYFHPDWSESQRQGLKQFYFWFAREERNHRFKNTKENRLWFKKFLYRFKDYTENMC